MATDFNLFKRRVQYASGGDKLGHTVAYSLWPISIANKNRVGHFQRHFHVYRGRISDTL